MKSEWSKFMEQIMIEYFIGEDKDGMPIGGFIEIGRDNNGSPSSIEVLPNKAYRGCWLCPCGYQNQNAIQLCVNCHAPREESK